MTRDDIIRIARSLAEKANECCHRSDGYEESMFEDIKLAIETTVAAEREACAKVCETLPRRFRTEFDSVSKECAAAIRARGR